jgi:hypothetical protein
MKVFAAVIITLAAAWLAWPDDDAAPAKTEAPQQEAPVAATVAAPQQNDGAMAFFSAPPSIAETPVSAAVSMANTRLHGDPDAPPIVRSTALPDVPSAAQLADPKAYLQYEAKQTLRVYASYVQAVDQQLPILRDDIARGRAIGIAPEKIAKAEAKARGLEAMRAKLLKEHPELAAAPSQAPKRE